MQLTLCCCNSFYMPATHSAYGCNRLITRLQLAYRLYTPSSTYIVLYPCNSLYIWLQLTQHTAATGLLHDNSIIHITYVALCACNWLYNPATHSLSLQLTLHVAATHSTRRCNSLKIWLQLGYCLYTPSSTCRWLYTAATHFLSLQLTLHVAATNSTYGCNWAIASTLRPWHNLLYVHATDHTASTPSLSMQLTLHVAATHSIYGCK